MMAVVGDDGAHVVEQFALGGTVAVQWLQLLEQSTGEEAHVIGVALVIPVDASHVEDAEAASIQDYWIGQVIPEVLEEHTLAQARRGDRQRVDAEPVENAEYRQRASQVVSPRSRLRPAISRRFAKGFSRNNWTEASTEPLVSTNPCSVLRGHS